MQIVKHDDHFILKLNNSEISELKQAIQDTYTCHGNFFILEEIIDRIEEKEK